MSTTSTFDVRYDRRLSGPFLSTWCPGGCCRRSRCTPRAGLFPLDLRFRKDVKSGAEHVSLYVGLTSVLDVASLQGREAQAQGPRDAPEER